jgi:hypothetical protein
MKRFGYILLCLVGLLLFSCEREQQSPEPQAMKTIHYQVSAGQSALSKATVDGSGHYIFQEGDRLYVNATGANADRLYGFLHLIQGAGTETAVFDGDLYCHFEFEPTPETALNVTLVGAVDDLLHTVSGGRITAGPGIGDFDYPSSACAATFDEAVRKYSHFTASGHYGDVSFTLAQQSSFLRCAVKFTLDDAGTAFTFKVLDGETELRSTEVVPIADESLSWARFVAVFPGGTELTQGQLSCTQGTGEPEFLPPFNAGASTILAANTYYDVNRSMMLGCEISVDFPSICDIDRGVPVRCTMVVESARTHINSAVLNWREKGASEWTSYDLFSDETFSSTHTTDLYTNDFSWTVGTTYQYQMVVTGNGGDFVANTPIRSMQIIRFNDTPNVQGAFYEEVYHEWTDPWWQTYANAHAWLESLPVYDTDTNKDFRQKAVICNTYGPFTINDLNFGNGDYIEALIDVSHCVFIRTVTGDLNSKPTKEKIIGLDNIFAIGPRSDIGWKPGVLQVYYPAHVGENDYLQLDALYPLTGTSVSKYSKLQVGTLDGTLLAKLSSEGFSWNGNLVTYYEDADKSKVVPNLVTKTTLYVGAVEGNHLSRATYKYIRVIREESD